MIYHKYIRRDISYNAMIYQRYRLGTHAIKMRFLGLLDSLLSSSGLTADGLKHLSGDILTHALGDTLGHVGGAPDPVPVRQRMFDTKVGKASE